MRSAQDTGEQRGDQRVNPITDIHCLQCGAPAKFDIVKQLYVCGHCGGKVGIGEAQEEKLGFRNRQRDRLRESVKKYRLFRTSCSGCGAEVVFEENEALSSCAFCGRNLVRTEYLDPKDMPESVIPFGITEKEAAEKLRDWCRMNRNKPEARKLLPLIPELKGFYLPYMLVRGPVHLTVSRMDSDRSYKCEGFMENAFVNCSEQLDNLLLDGMEPFNEKELREFDLAYVAGQRVKIPDIGPANLKWRIREEVAECYTPAVRKTLETKAVEISPSIDSVVELPVLLPVYYICRDDLMAAVNGQTGKVSVRALKESHYYFLPWWSKAIFTTLLLSGVSYGALCLFGMNAESRLLITGILGFFFAVVLLCLYSDTRKNSFSVESGRKIFTSGKETFHRERGKLVRSEEILERKTVPPVFFLPVDGKEQPVDLKFTSPVRVLRMILLTVTALFLPVILALILTGFNFSKINLGGSAVWFCIAVPVVPIYLWKFGIVELHDRPWIYTVSEDGKKRRYRKRWRPRITRTTVHSVLRALFVPPLSLAVWFGILGFITIVYLTAGGS